MKCETRMQRRSETAWNRITSPLLPIFFFFFLLTGSLVKRVKAKKPRSLKNQKFERSLGPSRAGRTSSAVRGEGRGRGRPARGGRSSMCALHCREELPTIYKCPYQGCTAVYRGADGMKVRRGVASVPRAAFCVWLTGRTRCLCRAGCRLVPRGSCEPGRMEN